MALQQKAVGYSIPSAFPVACSTGLVRSRVRVGSTTRLRYLKGDNRNHRPLCQPQTGGGSSTL